MSKEMSTATKACLTILIAEIQGCKDIGDIKVLLNTWIYANDLHPEDVVSVVSLDKLRAYIYDE